MTFITDALRGTTRVRSAWLSWTLSCSEIGSSVPKYGVNSLLLLTLVVACFSAFALYRNQAAYFAISILLPVTIGVFTRYALSRSKAVSVTATFVSAILCGAVMVAFGSYFRTFIVPSDGILVGDGWNSVILSTLFGAVIGCICGLLSTLLYLVVTSTIDLLSAKRNAG